MSELELIHNQLKALIEIQQEILKELKRIRKRPY